MTQCTVVLFVLFFCFLNNALLIFTWVDNIYLSSQNWPFLDSRIQQQTWNKPRIVKSIFKDIQRMFQLLLHQLLTSLTVEEGEELLLGITFLIHSKIVRGFWKIGNIEKDRRRIIDQRFCKKKILTPFHQQRWWHDE